MFMFSNIKVKYLSCFIRHKINIFIYSYTLIYTYDYIIFITALMWFQLIFLAGAKISGPSHLLHKPPHLRSNPSQHDVPLVEDTV